MAKTRPIVQRDTPPIPPPRSGVVWPSSHMFYRSPRASLLAVIVGLVRKQPTMAVVGAALIVAFVALHLTRARRGTKELVEEIARNPFKPKRVPKYPDSGLLG